MIADSTIDNRESSTHLSFWEENNTILTPSDPSVAKRNLDQEHVVHPNRSQIWSKLCTKHVCVWIMGPVVFAGNSGTSVRRYP